jgi:hypothetical protein
MYEKNRTSERSTQSKHGGKHIMWNEQMQDRVCGPQLFENTDQEALWWPLQVYLQVKIHVELEVFVL